MMDEQAGMEMTVKELRREIVGLKWSNLDRSTWREWDSEQVLVFIMGCVEDETLKQYEEAIRTEVFESEYSGQALAAVTSSHVKDMGIKNIRVRNAVLGAIQELVKGPNQNQQHLHLPADEGMDAEVASTAYLK